MQTLDYHDASRPHLHRPRLAAIACFLLAAVFLFFLLGIPSNALLRDQPFQKYVDLTRWIISYSLYVIATICLAFGDLTRNYSPRPMALPRLALPIFCLVYAVLDSIYACKIVGEFDMRRYYDTLPLSLAARIFLSLTYAIGLCYAFQIAAVLRNTYLYVLLFLVLIPAFLFIIVRIIYTWNTLAEYHHFPSFFPNFHLPTPLALFGDPGLIVLQFILFLVLGIRLLSASKSLPEAAR